MITAIQETPAQEAGVSPSERAKVLRSIGACVSVQVDDLVQGNVLMLPHGAFVILRKQRVINSHGGRIVMRALEGASLHTMSYTDFTWVPRLELPTEVTEDGKSWTIRTGDVVVYPRENVAAIRHAHGWMRTAAPWSPYADAEVLLHLREGRAQVVRSAVREEIPARTTFPVGGVVACRDRGLLEPSVWVRTADDCWTGSIRSVTASDLMIRYELKRGTYQAVWVPEEQK